jgi:Protein of unknown function (DUF1064)
VGRFSRASERRAWTRFIEGKGEAAPNKYRAEKKQVNGRVFDSTREANRAIELQWLEQLGEITELQYQVRYTLAPKQPGERAVVYRADFVYRNKAGELVVEDAKGVRTPDYVIKRKLMLLVHGIRIREV